MASQTPSGAWSAPPEWLAHLEAARGQLSRCVWLLMQEDEPPIDLAPVASPLREAVGALYDALDRRGDRLNGIRRALSSIDASCVHLSPNVGGTVAYARSSLDAARIDLDTAEKSLARLPIDAPPAEPGPVLASGDTPRVHHLDRPSLVPDVRFASPPKPEPPPAPAADRPATFDELAANIASLKARAEERLSRAADKRNAAPAEPDPPAPVPRGFAKEIPSIVSETSFVEARARDMLEEVAMVGLQRMPLFGDPWRTSLPLEQRMCRAIDAVAALGATALDYVERWAVDGPVKDATRMFAVAMTMGCIDGHDALGVIERVFQELSATDSTSRDGLVAALCLAPHPGLPMWMRSWLGDGDANRRAVAIETLSFRGWVQESELVAAAVDQPAVAMRALPDLGRLVPSACADVVANALASTDTELRWAAWRAMALANHPLSTATLREALHGDDSDRAAMLLAICGDDHDAERLLGLLEPSPRVAIVDALGWSGSPAALPKLIELLEHDDEGVQVAAGRALDRITGAGLWEEAEVVAEDIFVIEPPDPDVGEPQPKRLVLVTGDSRDLPPEPATETVERPTVSVVRWRAWYREHGSQWPLRQRYRLGSPYTPASSLIELDTGMRTLEERRWLVDELVIQTGAYVRFDPRDWVVAQEAMLEGWRQPAQRASSQPGSWHRPSRR